MKTKLQNLLLDLKHGVIDTDRRQIELIDIESLSIRDEDRGGAPMVCTGIELLPNNELAIFVSREDGKKAAVFEKPTLPSLAKAFVI